MMYFGKRTFFLRFISVATLCCFVPASIEFGGMFAWAEPLAPARSGNSAVCLLPAEAMQLYVGGPDETEEGPYRAALPDAAVLLASFDGGSTSELGRLSTSVLENAAHNDAENALVAIYAVLSSYPDSFEAANASREAYSLIASLSDDALLSCRKQWHDLGRPASAAAWRVWCGLQQECAARFPGEDTGANGENSLDAWLLGLEEALRAFPNAPEAYEMAGLLATQGGDPGVLLLRGIMEAHPGTAAAWRAEALLTGQAPAWARLASAEARYGLLAAWREELQNGGLAEDVKAARAAQGCALAEDSFAAYPDSAVQGRIAPCWYDLVRALPREAQDARVLQVRDMLNKAAPSAALFMGRIFTFDHLMWSMHNRGDGAMEMLNALDMMPMEKFDEMMSKLEGSAQDKARLEYYYGYLMFNKGWELAAITHYERAMAYKTSDVIVDYSQAARAYAMEAVYDYTGEVDLPAEAYRAYLCEHPHGAKAGHALRSLARIYGRSEDPYGAALFLERLIDRFPFDPDASNARESLAKLPAPPQRLAARVRNGKGAQKQDLAMCGPAALHRMLASSKVIVPEDELARLAGTTAQGTSMQGLIDAAAAKGVRLAGVQSAQGKELTPPFIAFVNGNHFVFVPSREKDGWMVEDTHREAVWQSEEELRVGWDGKAIVAAENPEIAALLDAASLIGAVGGDSFPNNNGPECRNGHNEPVCNCSSCELPPGGPGPGKKRCELKNNTPLTHRIKTPCDDPDTPAPCNGGNPTFASCEPRSAAPGAPAQSPSSPSKYGNGFNPSIMVFQGSPQLQEGDIGFSVNGGMRIDFRRVYGNQFGYKRSYYSAYPADLPYKNNIGESWTHAYNMHLSVSQEYEFVLFHDYMGNPKTYMCNGADATYIYYRRSVSSTYEAHGHSYRGELWEEGITLKRHIATGTWTMVLPNGVEYGFSAETAWPEHYARLEYIQNASGVRITFQYDAQGRLSRVNAPTGDPRYLNLLYSGTSNRIVCIYFYDGSTAVSWVWYYYDSQKRLTRVARDGDFVAADDVHYTYGSDSQVPYSFFLSSITDENGDTADFSYTYAEYADWGLLCSSILVEKGDSLKTLYTRDTTTNEVTAQNLDVNDAALTKIVYNPDWYATTVSWVDYHVTPTGTNRNRWAYAYDTNHFLTDVYRPADNYSGGTVWHMGYAYNGKGRVTSLQYKGPSGNTLTTSWQYAPDGLQLNSRTDPTGLVAQYFYTAGLLTQEKHPDVGTNGIQYAYDAQGNLTSVMDPLGHVTSYGYDARGNRVSVTNPLNKTTTMQHDSYGRVTSVTDPLNHTTSYVYNESGCGCGGVGKLAEVTNALYETTSFTYDNKGNMTESIDPTGFTTEYAYDELGRMTSVESPANSGNIRSFTYDRLGRLVSSQDEVGDVVTYTYDHRDRVLSQTDEVGTVSYTYGVMGQLLTVTDELSHVTTYTYNSMYQRVATMTLQPAKYVVNQYDTYGRLTKTGAGSSATIDPTEYTYSATTGLLARTRYYTGASYYDASYTYDANGRVSRLDDWRGTSTGIQYGFDAAGQLTSILDDTNKQVSYGYDDAGRMTSMTDTAGAVTAYAYNNGNRLTGITIPGGLTWSFSYNAAGMPTQYVLPNNTRTEYGYDTRHRLTSIVHRNLANNAVLDSFEYALDEVGNITEIEQADGTSWDYEYGDRNRLESAIRRDDADDIVDIYTYAYDDGDNMTSRLRWNVPSSTIDSWAYAYNNANEQTSMTLNGGTPETRTYDAWGRLATRAQGTYSATYGYRYGSRLYSAASNFPGDSNVTLEYRGDGKLHRRTVGSAYTTYRYGAGWDPVIEEASSGARYAWVMTQRGSRGKKLACVIGGLQSGIPLYAYHDHLGSIRRLRWFGTSSFGSDEFEPYGGVYETTGYIDSYDNLRHFALHPEDPALQAYRAPYRVYSPAMARWTTRDPLGMVDGPNVYGYADNAPISNNDMFGLSTRDGLSDDMTRLLNCIESFMGPVKVISGARPNDIGSAHQTGEAIDVKNPDHSKPDALESCEIKNSAKYCAEMLGLRGLRICRNKDVGHIHIDIIGEKPGKNAPCSAWGGYEDPCGCK